MSYVYTAYILILVIFPATMLRNFLKLPANQDE